MATLNANTDNELRISLVVNCYCCAMEKNEKVAFEEIEIYTFRFFCVQCRRGMANKSVNYISRSNE